jgi:phosphoglycolate phosphatase
MRRSLVVFDLDGTLVDSVRDLAEAANELVVALGGAPLSVGSVAGMVGDGAGMLVRRALRAAGVDADP